MNLAVGAGSHLGIKVRGGREFGLGIFVTGVDRGSAAELGGLKASVVPPITLIHRSASPLSFVQRLNDTSLPVQCWDVLTIPAAHVCPFKISLAIINLSFYHNLLFSSPFLRFVPRCQRVLPALNRFLYAYSFQFISSLFSQISHLLVQHEMCSVANCC